MTDSRLNPAASPTKVSRSPPDIKLGTCLWQVEHAPDSADPVSLPSQCDVAVIGGGYTGVAAARALARSGAQVVLLERETPGWGASTRNGGFVLPGFKLDPVALGRRLGLDRARQLFAESVASIDHLEEVVREEGIECDFRRSGHITLAESQAQLRALGREHGFLRSGFSHQTELLAAAEIAGEIGADRYVGGLLDPSAAAVQPARLFHGLAAAARRSGALLAGGAEARRIGRQGGAFAVETPRGTVRAGQVLVVTNGYSGPVHREFRRRVVPIGSHIIATAPLEAGLARRLLPRNRVMNDSRNLLHYFRLYHDRLIFGGRASFRPSRGLSDREAARVLHRDMLKIFPDLRDVPVEYAWSGNVAFTRDQMPHLAALDGVLCAGGYCGHGVAMAIYLGDRIGRHLGGGAGLPHLASLEFPAIPLYQGRPWFLPLAGAWYRLKDLAAGLLS